MRKGNCVLSLLIQNNNKKELKTKRKGIDKKEKGIAKS
jgi:hypothetical protein